VTTVNARVPAVLDPVRDGSGPSAARDLARRTPLWKTILSPLASLRLTVALLAMSMLIIFTGTAAQKELGLHDVLDMFFYGWGVWIPTRYLFPLWPWGWVHLQGAFPFIGGRSLILLLLLNLLAAHSVRFKVSWKRAGILLIHFSLILLLVGELASHFMKDEDLLGFHQGDTRQWVQDPDKFELAVIDESGPVTDHVVVIPDARLRKPGESITHADLPFSLTIDKWYPNAKIVGPMEQKKGVDRLATAGETRLGVLEVQRAAGIETKVGNAPAVFATLRAGGQPIGTYLFSASLNAQTLDAAGKKFKVDLRPKRTYLPYALHLNQFKHETHLGTNEARNFASRVQLIDKAAGIDREVEIKMNQPLRYQGRTFYQASFDEHDPTWTVLQVVRNPIWTLPYLACLLGGIGLVVHFGTVLLNFLRKRANTGQLLGFSANQAVAQPISRQAKRGAQRRGESSYMLAPSSGGKAAIILPLLVASLGFIYVLSHALKTPPLPPSGFDLNALGELPVSFQGRMLPLDTVARAGLKIVSGRESITVEKEDSKDGEAHRVPAIQWLADVMANTPAADEYKVFRINHPDIKALLGISGPPMPTDRPREKGKVYETDQMFSFAQILLDNPANGPALQKQIDALEGVSDKRMDDYQRKIASLSSQLRVYMKLAQVGAMLNVHDVWTDPVRGQALLKVMDETKGIEPEKMTPEQRTAFMQVGRIREQVSRMQMIAADEKHRSEDLYFVPPVERDGKAWRGLGQTLATWADASRGGSIDPSSPEAALPAEMASFFDIIRDFRDGKAAAFNGDLARYRAQLETLHPKSTANAAYEAFFNRFDPFTSSIVFYVAAFMVVLGSWLGWTKPLWRTAVSLLVLAFVVHTIGLVMRIQISGRPPVTSLYTASVFIGWGVVLMSLGLEAVFRNGLGVATSAGVGFMTLLLAGGLATMEGDTMKPLEAVLDTNFWLATHVVCISLGYASMFLAGALAIAYVIGGVFTPGMADPERRKSLVRMSYGILCFAMLFSFVGTILGGIWADQSWGRFWGWDPKENGAILIVLSVATVLHARWAGLVKERGVMLLSILGNIVTAWSFFGTNLMGVGLHSYGFMESGVFWLSTFVYSQLVIFGIGLLPTALWRSNAAAGPLAA
jgi:ABC-type transport system involved in cytochrome c biogenesis permease subunit